MLPQLFHRGIDVSQVLSQGVQRMDLVKDLPVVGEGLLHAPYPVPVLLAGQKRFLIRHGRPVRHIEDMQVAAGAEAPAIRGAVVVQAVPLRNKIRQPDEDNAVHLAGAAAVLFAVIGKGPGKGTQGAHQAGLLHQPLLQLAFPVVMGVKGGGIHMEKGLHLFCLSVQIVSLRVFGDDPPEKCRVV